MSLYLPVLYGTVREGRITIGLARHVLGRLERRPGVETRLFDPRDLPFGNVVLREWEMPSRPPAVEEFVREMGRADGFVVVTPEYNYGIPGTLKNMLDHVWDEWNHKPFGVVSGGGIGGGLRATDQFRQVVTGLRAIPIPAHVPVFSVDKQFSADGPLGDTADLDRRLSVFFDQLEWYARALSTARTHGTPPI